MSKHICEICGRYSVTHREICTEQEGAIHWPSLCCDGCPCDMTEAKVHLVPEAAGDKS